MCHCNGLHYWFIEEGAFLEKVQGVLVIMQFTYRGTRISQFSSPDLLMAP